MQIPALLPRCPWDMGWMAMNANGQITIFVRRGIAMAPKGGGSPSISSVSQQSFRVSMMLSSKRVTSTIRDH
jgi:hypothetical protein